MKITKSCLVEPGSRPDLLSYQTRADVGLARAEAEERTRDNIEAMEELQFRLFAESRRGLLVVLQAMDAGGKDGTIRKVLGDLNPQGVRVWSFGRPSERELGHDFLWRIHQRAPRRGHIGVFNRSHYEDVLVVRVDRLVPKDVWSKRYAIINDFERALEAEGTTIIKLFLHISQDEQKERLMARLTDPTRHWKFEEQDLAKRAQWNDYMKAYEDVLHRCSTATAPWYVVPADRKWARNLIVSEIVRDTLEEMDPKTPDVSFDKNAMIRRLEG